MAKMCAIANIVEYDGAGKTTAKPIRLSACLCSSEEPQFFEIILPDRRKTRQRAIYITRAEIERVLADNPPEHT
jgi:hypothetical protein